MGKPWIIKFISLWPPFLGAGIRLKKIAPDYRSVHLEMKLRFWNTNYVGTHYGGSLYSITDPWVMLLLMENLGRDYVVWDKAALIRFKRPGKGRVHVRFELTQEEIDEVKALADREPKVEPVFTVNVVDDAGEIIAEVEKTLHVRRKAKS